MTTSGIFLIVVAVAIVLFIGGLVFSGKKKGKDKKKKDEPNKEKVVEPAIKSDRPKIEEKKEPVEEQPVVVMPDGFRVIRKKSEVKINKKAIKGDSRNPSITRVFVDGKNVEEEKKKEEETPIISEVQGAMSVNIPEEVGRFGAREPQFKDLSERTDGMPNRSPTLEERINFASHLNVSKDNNMSGVSGTGINKVIDDVETIDKSETQSTEQLLNSVRQNIARNGGFGLNNPMDFLNGGQDNSQTQKAKTPHEKLKDIDAQTLIIADAIMNKKRGGKNGKN